MRISPRQDTANLERKEAVLAVSPAAVRIRARAGTIDSQLESDRYSMNAKSQQPREKLPRRLQAMLWTIGNVTLMFLLTNVISVLQVAHRDLFMLYYGAFLPLVAMLWLWTVFVTYAERHHVRYEVCFSTEDQKKLLHSGQLWVVSNALSTIVLGSGLAFAIHCSMDDTRMASFHPPALYLVLLALLLNPANFLFKESRLHFSATAWRVFTPLRTVTWADFLLADVLTSLAKPLSDTERAVCHLMTGPVMDPAEERCGSSSLVIPVGLALPYLWRFLQCIRVFLDTGARPQIYNAIKYSTAFPVIVLSVMQLRDPGSWHSFYRPLWLAAALVNSCYSYYWDVERDWEIQLFSAAVPQRTCTPRPVLQPQLLYRRPFYMYLLVSNFAMRLAWTHKLSPHLRRHQLAAMLFVMLEGFRRFQWLFVRIEVELRKLQAYRPELGVLVPHAGHAVPPPPHEWGHAEQGERMRGVEGSTARELHQP